MRNESLDPEDWAAFRRQSHRMLDEAIDYLEAARERPVWRAVPPEVKRAFEETLPQEPATLAGVYEDFRETIFPYATGNTHPRFFGYVHGAGTPSGMLAEMLAAAMNSNVGGREHGAVYVERQVIAWARELFGFPEDASGLLVTGTSMANLIGVLVARRAALGASIRTAGLPAGVALRAYASSAAHGCIAKALDIAGIGSNALHSVAVDADYRLIPGALTAAIAADRAQGAVPFIVVGTVGTADVGAVDDLAAIARICAQERVWFHVDGAFGALAALSPELRPLLSGIERADSIGFDFHKWLHVPYDAACVLVRDGAMHHDTFAIDAKYLARLQRGLAGGEPWYCDYGPDLSRGFRALKVWFTIKEHGARRLGAAIARNCRQARLLAERISEREGLELLAPVGLNIVCFRVRAPELDGPELNALNAHIVAELQEQGIAAPSTTMLGRDLAIRVNITNHRTTDADVEVLLAAVDAIARQARSAAPAAKIR